MFIFLSCFVQERHTNTCDIIYHIPKNKMVIVEQFVIYHNNEKQMTFIHKLYIPDCDYIAAVPLYVPAAIHTGRVIEGP